MVIAWVYRASWCSIVGRELKIDCWLDGMLKISTKLCRTCLSEDWELSLSGSPSGYYVLYRCVSCDLRLLRRKLMSCAWCRRRVWYSPFVYPGRMSIKTVSIVYKGVISAHARCDGCYLPHEWKFDTRDKTARDKWWYLYSYFLPRKECANYVRMERVDV